MNIAIIPSRMKSKRFPGKPIRKIENLEIINHVYLRSSLSRKLNEVYVATCDQEIVDAIKK